MLKKRGLVIGLVLFVLVAAGAYTVLREPEAASAPIEAIPLATAAVAATAIPVTATSEPTTNNIEPEPPANSSGDTAAKGTAVFSINPAESQVRFELDEDFRGSRKTVVGVTDQVAGEIGFDLAAPTAARVGVIQINARTLATDNNFRNRALRNQILNSNAYEFITFTPTAVTGLPDTIAIGGLVTFNVIGDLTIKAITQEVAFTVRGTAVSDTRISGTAAAVISRNDFQLTIPDVPNVANVEEEVELYIDFVADKIE